MLCCSNMVESKVCDSQNKICGTQLLYRKLYLTNNLTRVVQNDGPFLNEEDRRQVKLSD